MYDVYMQNKEGKLMNKSCVCYFRIGAVLLSIFLLLPFVCSCRFDVSPDVSFSDNETIGISTVVTFEDKNIEISYRDCVPPDGEVVIYTRAYTVDEKPMLKLGIDQPGRTAVSVCLETIDRNELFVIQKITADATKDVVIPYNGFVLTMPSELANDLELRIGEEVVLSDLQLIGEPERMDAGSFYPDLDEKFSLQRRVLYRDPYNGISQDGIYFLSAEYTAEPIAFPKESVVVSLRSVTAASYRVTSMAYTTSAVNSSDQLVFVGAYECAYAQTFLKDGLKLTFKNLDLVSSYSDCEALLLADTLYRFTDEKHNTDRITLDGVYLFDNEYSSVATPESDIDRVDIVVINNIVVHIQEKNARSMLPLSGGVIVSFAGNSVALANDLSVGDVITTFMIDSDLLPEQHVKIGDNAFEYTKIDTVRAPEGVVTIYTPSFGATTQTNQYGLEIAVSDGKVLAVEKGIGDIKIPADGFVLSIHKDSPLYALAAKEVSVGDKASLATGNRNYTVADLSVTGINSTRVQDALIVYRGVSSTATNAYGYEIIVDADGNMVGDGYLGNAAVPKGGFVLSGHGVNKEALVSVYRYGGKVFFDEEKMKVMLITTPETMLIDAAFRLDGFLSSLENAKEQLLYLNYTELDQTIAGLEKCVSETKLAFENGDFDTAVKNIETLDGSWEELQYALLETHPVENRSMWYRSVEKSDAEVRAVVEKMAALNINAVYLETWYNGRFIGFSDNELIAHSTANGSYDAMDGFVRICHEYGIEVHAWVENFFIGTVEAQEQANLELSAHFEGRWLKDRNGKNTFFYTASNTNFIFLNPYDKEVRTLLIDFYREIITKYDIDGLHLDYIRFPELNYGSDDFGYNDDIVSAWQKENQTTVDPATLKSGSLYQSWIKFRQEIINSFVAEVYQMVSETDSSVWLSAAVYPGVPDIKNDIFQDCANWVENGYMDELFSMSYGEDNAYVASNAAKFVTLAGDKCFYSTGISAFGETTEQNFALQMTQVTNEGADGVAIFSLANINSANYQNPIQKGAFRMKSLQVNRLSETVSAYLSHILKKANEVYIPYAGLSATDYQSLCALLQPIIEDADSFNLENASYEEKIQYCIKVKASLADVMDTVRDYISDDAKREFVLSDFEELDTWMTKSQNRLSARMKS